MKFVERGRGFVRVPDCFSAGEFYSFPRLGRLRTADCSTLDTLEYVTPAVNRHRVRALRIVSESWDWKRITEFLTKCRNEVGLLPDFIDEAEPPKLRKLLNETT